MADTLTRTTDGVEIPVAGKFDIDPTHTSASFTVRHMGLSKVRGGFTGISGSVVIADDPTASEVDVTLDAASFDTGSADRDGHVKSADFLDVETYPNLTYRSTGVRSEGNGWIVDGELTVRDVTRPVPLTVTFEGAAKDPWGNDRIAFTAEGEIDRDQFGITWNQVMETGGVLVGKTVKLSIDVQAVAVA